MKNKNEENVLLLYKSMHDVLSLRMLPKKPLNYKKYKITRADCEGENKNN